MTKPVLDTEQAWQKIFEDLHILDEIRKDAIAYVSAKDIKDCTDHEPRLMTKFDTRSSRPHSLAEQGITILPVSNGRYALVRHDGYHDFERNNVITPHENRRARSVKTLPWDTQFASESQVLDSALISSLMGTFTGETELFLTIRGRLRSPQFEFFVGGGSERLRLQANGTQIEVDGGYEGNRIYLIETKMGQRDDFIIRQLYYPYRMWLEKKTGKQVIPILLTYSNRVFSFRQYCFKSHDDYDSIALVGARDYVLGEAEESPDLRDILATSRQRALPGGVPFPQADDLQKVIDLVDAVAEGIGDKLELAERFDYDHRQSDYYGNAAVFLGLVDRTGSGFSHTPKSYRFVRRSRMQRITEVLKKLGELPVFRQALERVASGSQMSREQVTEEIQRQTGLNLTTASRRAQTVESWVRWAQQMTQRPKA